MYTETNKIRLVYNADDHKKYNSILSDHVIDVARKYNWKAPLIRNNINNEDK